MVRASPLAAELETSPETFWSERRQDSAKIAIYKAVVRNDSKVRHQNSHDIG